MRARATLDIGPTSAWELIVGDVGHLFSGPLGTAALIVGVPALVAFGRFAVPSIARSFAGRSPEARAGLDAALGLSVVLLPMLVLLGLEAVPLSRDLGRFGLLFGVPLAAGVAWGARRGTVASGGKDDLTGGLARGLGAALGVLVATIVTLLG